MSSDVDDAKMRNFVVSWQCSRCSWLNKQELTKCDGCDQSKPQGALEFEVDEAEIKAQEPLSTFNFDVVKADFNAHEQKGESETSSINFVTYPKGTMQNLYYDSPSLPFDAGVPVEIYPYTQSKHPPNPKLLSLFGQPYRITHHSSAVLSWEASNIERLGIIFKTDSNFALTGSLHLRGARVGSRTVALNQHNGYIATLDYSPDNYMIVNILKWVGSNSLVSLSTFETDITTDPFAHNCRIRFFADDIYIFDPTSYKIHHFRIDKLHKIFTRRVLHDTYFAAASVQDVMITDSLLIILFSGWVGLYTLDEFEWCHVIKCLYVYQFPN